MKFTEKLHLRDKGNGKTFVVTMPFKGLRGDGSLVSVPAGFTTDLATIPRLAQMMVPKLGKFNQAAVTHDWLYHQPLIFEVRTHGKGEVVFSRACDRAEADLVLLEGMKEAGVRLTRRQLIYWTVRAGGWVAWNKCRKAEKDV